MAETVPSEHLVEWAKTDNRRFLHAVYRVGNLDKTIKFYTECLGMQLLRKRDIPEENYSNAFLGFGPEETHFVLELTYNYGKDSYDIGSGFGHFAIATEDDPDDYTFELIQRGPTPEPLCQVMLRVTDLDRAINFYEKALGMKLLRKKDNKKYKVNVLLFIIAAVLCVHYSDDGVMHDEMESTVLELTYNYGVTEYTKGDAYAQIAISTDDVYKSAEVVNLAIQELGGKITRQPGPIPGINTKITSFLDPDGWKIAQHCNILIASKAAYSRVKLIDFLLNILASKHLVEVLVDNQDFLKELHKEE
ncbi:hypothetical protein IFM89_032280 [Coptis chinensis]|uniref:VOC domain-containing protein n=1 Tax=Coptis chinensis TaxID=261450 RepID=A0A835LF83_9MAGN|nr:hypothetical protein IFM89_032280 [Coptis chinensis]